MINVSKLYCGAPGHSDQLRYSNDDSIGPVVVYNCTPECNLGCRHCYSFSEKAASDATLTTQQAKDLLGQLKAERVPVVLFSGGEPLLRKDIFQLLEYACYLNLTTAISTNGTLITPEIAKKLTDANVSYAGISIDGPEGFHDDFRRCAGSHKAALAGLENCRNQGIKTGLRFTITTENSRHITFIFELAVSLGTRRICFYHLIGAGRAKQLIDRRPSAAQSRRIVDTIITETKKYTDQNLLDEVLTVGNHADGPYLLLKLEKTARENPAKTKTLEQTRKLLTANGGNRIGEKIIAVGHDGNVYPDQFWTNYSLGSIKQNSFRKIRKTTSDPVMYNLLHKDTFVHRRCRQCRFFSLCKGNYRFLTKNPNSENWLNEPPCYLTDEEILHKPQITNQEILL